MGLVRCKFSRRYFGHQPGTVVIVADKYQGRNDAISPELAERLMADGTCVDADAAEPPRKPKRSRAKRDAASDQPAES